MYGSGASCRLSEKGSHSQHQYTKWGEYENSLHVSKVLPVTSIRATVPYPRQGLAGKHTALYYQSTQRSISARHYPISESPLWGKHDEPVEADAQQRRSEIAPNPPSWSQ